MKTFIVPTDFSDTSKNAALYAVQIAAGVQDSKIILYNVFDIIFAGSDSSPLEDEPGARKKIMELALESVKQDMLGKASLVDISYVAEESNSFIDSLERFARDQQADLIIIGITGTSRVEQILMGSNTLNIVRRNVCPVIIVPPHAQFKGIKNVLFATDFKDVENTTPIKFIKRVLDLFKADVFVVNVDSEHLVELSEDYKRERAKMETMLDGYKTEFYFIKQSDFVDAISQFAADKNIDLILTVPRKHSFVSKLFLPGHTKKLAYHSHVPIVAVHE